MSLTDEIKKLIAEVKRLKTEIALSKKSDIAAQDTIGRLQKIRESQEADIADLKAGHTTLQRTVAGQCDTIVRLNDTIEKIIKDRDEKDARNLALADSIASLTADIDKISGETASLMTNKKDIDEAWKLLEACDYEPEPAPEPALAASVTNIVTAQVATRT